MIDLQARTCFAWSSLHLFSQQVCMLSVLCFSIPFPRWYCCLLYYPALVFASLVSGSSWASCLQPNNAVGLSQLPRFWISWSFAPRNVSSRNLLPVLAVNFGGRVNVRSEQEEIARDYFLVRSILKSVHIWYSTGSKLRYWQHDMTAPSHYTVHRNQAAGAKIRDWNWGAWVAVSKHVELQWLKIEWFCLFIYIYFFDCYV